MDIHALGEPTASGRLLRPRVAGRYWSYSWYWMLTHPWLFFTELWDVVRDFCERGWYGYSVTDLWSLNEYINAWLPGALRNLADHGYSMPDGLSPEEWHAILHDMADKWERGDPDTVHFHKGMPWEEYMAQVERCEAISQEALDLFSKWYRDLWD